QRHFVRTERPEFLYLAFHGTWSSSLHELNSPAIRGRVDLRDWVLQRTGGKVDPGLLERFLGGARPAAMLYVYDAEQLKRDDGVSLFFCEGMERNGARPTQACDRTDAHNAIPLAQVESPE